MVSPSPTNRRRSTPQLFSACVCLDGPRPSARACTSVTFTALIAPNVDYQCMRESVALVLLSPVRDCVFWPSRVSQLMCIVSAIVSLCRHGTPSPSADIGYLFPVFPRSPKPRSVIGWSSVQSQTFLRHSRQRAVNFHDPRLPCAVTDTDALGSISPSLGHRHAHHCVYTHTHTHTHSLTRCLARRRSHEQAAQRNSVACTAHTHAF